MKLEVEKIIERFITLDCSFLPNCSVVETVEMHVVAMAMRNEMKLLRGKLTYFMQIRTTSGYIIYTNINPSVDFSITLCVATLAR